MKAFFKVIQPDKKTNKKLFKKYIINPKIKSFQNNELVAFQKMNHNEQIEFIKNITYLNKLLLICFSEKSHILFRNDKNERLKYYSRKIKNVNQKVIDKIILWNMIENIIRNENIL